MVAQGALEKCFALGSGFQLGFLCDGQGGMRFENFGGEEAGAGVEDNALFSFFVIPAEAGIRGSILSFWIPAFAGMTDNNIAHAATGRSGFEDEAADAR